MSGIFLLCQESRTCAVATRTLRLQRPTAGHPTRPCVPQLSPSTASRICSRPSTGTSHKTRRSSGAFLGRLRASLDGTLGCCSSPCSSSRKQTLPSQTQPIKKPFAAHDGGCANVCTAVHQGQGGQLARVLSPASAQTVIFKLLYAISSSSRVKKASNSGRKRRGWVVRNPRC